LQEPRCFNFNTMIDRRKFLTNAAVLAGGVIIYRSNPAFAAVSGKSFWSGKVKGNLKIVPDSPAHLVPFNYTGLSYELAQLTDPKFFSVSNKELVALFKILSPRGVLRLGGNSSESCWLKVDPSTTAPELKIPDIKKSEHWMPAKLFMIPAESIPELAGFLRATGWQLIYGLNFGHSSPERLAKEAEFIAKYVPHDQLLYFQIGNEPDFYRDSINRTRPANWDFNDYIKEWTACARAISQSVPNAAFGGPDVGANSDWIKQFIPAAEQNLGKRLVAVTGHYYASGPPDNPNVTIENLLRNNPKIGQSTKGIADLAAKNHLYYRMTEGNSCYRGGKPGMSDTLASALWGGDYMLTLAAAGCAGINLHGGSRNILKAALGNHLPGEKVASESSDSKGSYYTPIAGEVNYGFKARPIFYGMMLANQFADTEMKNVVLQAGNINATAYAGKAKDGWRIAIFNKDASSDLDLTVQLPEQANSANIWRLTGPRIDATNDVSLAGAVIGPDLSWEPETIEKCSVNNNQCRLTIPHFSAALLFLK
jgi:hypothetical protein